MSVSRREFLIGVPAAGAVLALAPLARRGPQSPGGSEATVGASNASNASNGPNAPDAPVVSFHLDQPYLDLTGLEKPYVPPVGMRSGASLSEEEVFSRFYGFI